VAYVSKRKNRFTAIPFATSHCANSSGGGDGGLGSIADAVGFNTIK